MGAAATGAAAMGAAAIGAAAMGAAAMDRQPSAGNHGAAVAARTGPQRADTRRECIGKMCRLSAFP